MNEAVTLGGTDKALLQIVYELMGQREAWPTFTAVDLRADRELGIEDAQAALVAAPAEYIRRPWHAHGFYDNDEVRLTLRGVAECEGGPDDLALLEQLVAWIVELERKDTGGPEDNLIASSQAFAAHLGITLDPSTDDDVESEAGPGNTDEAEGSADSTEARAPSDSEAFETPEPPSEAVVLAEIGDARAQLIRIRVLADLLPHFWTGAGWQTDTPWHWQYTVDRKRVRPYRHVQGLEALLEYVDSQERARLAAVGAVTRNAVPLDDSDVGGALPHIWSSEGTDVDVLLTLLREEIAEAAADLVRADRFDDAIFAAFRRVEHEVQQHACNPSIGNDLIKQAFREMKSPIRISEREQDKDRLVELFAGAIGLFKGDRSHKDRPLLPCRSRRECLRLLAHASSLLDLLDRDIDRAPSVRGYEHHQGDTLTLWVERAGAQVDVWLDETILLDKISFRTGTLVVSVAGAPVGEHRIHLVEGTRQGSARSVWLTREPGRSSWYRVVEVNVPLYADALGQQQLDVAGVRLAVREAGVESERIVPTREIYQVGHYVEWHWSNTAAVTGAVWVRDRIAGPLSQVWNSSTLFNGQPVAPAHAERLMKIGIEPGHLRLRSGDKVPLRVLGHFTDGTATWTKQLDDPKVTPADEGVAFFKGGAVIANGPGSTTLRCLHADCYAEASVDVATHPRGTMTEFITGLPPVSGIAWTPNGLVVSTGGTGLWQVGNDGVYRLVAATPPLSVDNQGTDTIVAREDGELAVRLVGNRDVLVLHNGDDYRSSHWVQPDTDGVPMAFVWDGGELIIAMNTGAVYRVGMDGTAKLIATVEGHPVDMACRNDSFLVLCGPAAVAPSSQPRSQSAGRAHRNTYLWHVPLDDPSRSVDLLEDHELANLSGVLWTGSDVFLSEFHGGTLLLLRDNQVSAAATGLTNPSQLTISDKGDIYVAEFGAGAIRRVLP